jgi:hypothetical protein
MKISTLPNVIKVCDITLNTTDSNNMWDTNWIGSNDILTQNNGRCYFIVVDGVIYKIGYSDSKKGIKNTIGSYKSSGNSGSPSDRTHGIHIFIAEELLKGKKVEIFFMYNEMINIDITLMDGSVTTVTQSISGKILEMENLKLYKKLNNDSFPKWNFQESGTTWPTYIIESRRNLLDGTPAKLSDLQQGRVDKLKELSERLKSPFKKKPLKD